MGRLHAQVLTADGNVWHQHFGEDEMEWALWVLDEVWKPDSMQQLFNERGDVMTRGSDRRWMPPSFPPTLLRRAERGTATDLGMPKRPPV